MTTKSTAEYLASLIHELCKLPQETEAVESGEPVACGQDAAPKRMRYMPHWAMPDRSPAG